MIAPVSIVALMKWQSAKVSAVDDDSPDILRDE
jgi:hypothetical protein